MRPDSIPTEIKGFAVRGLFRYAKQAVPGGIAALLDSLEPADRRLFEESIKQTRCIHRGDERCEFAVTWS